PTVATAVGPRASPHVPKEARIALGLCTWFSLKPMMLSLWALIAAMKVVCDLHLRVAAVNRFLIARCESSAPESGGCREQLFLEAARILRNDAFDKIQLWGL